MGYYITLDQLRGGVDNADSLIPIDFNSSYTLNNGLNLKDMRDNAIENLKGLLGALGYSGAEVSDPTAAMADLNKRIEEFHQTTSSFNGQELRIQIMNPLKGIVVNEAQAEILKFKSMVQGKQRQINQVFIQVVEQVANGIIPDEAGQITADAVATELYALLNQMTINLNTGAVTFGGGKLLKGEIKDLLKDSLKPAIFKKLKSGITSIHRASWHITLPQTVTILAQAVPWIK